MALRASCLVHFALFLVFTGCALHLPVGMPSSQDAEVGEAQSFVKAVSEKMPLWDADSLAPYERAEIATVKADIALARQSTERDQFFQLVDKLRDDWDALLALDEMLKKELLT
jgi:hypothetical protein